MDAEKGEKEEKERLAKSGNSGEQGGGKMRCDEAGRPIDTLLRRLRCLPENHLAEEETRRASGSGKTIPGGSKKHRGKKTSTMGPRLDPPFRRRQRLRRSRE